MTLIDQIKQHIAESGSSQGKVAKEAGINAGALSAYLNENYKGNNEELEAKLIAYLERIEAKKREFVEAPSFIETKTANQIFGSLRFAQNTGVLAINRKTGDVVVKTNGHLTATAQGGATINANTVVNGTLHATGKITSDEEVSAPVVKQGTVELGTHKHGGSPEPNK